MYFMNAIKNFRNPAKAQEPKIIIFIFLTNLEPLQFQNYIYQQELTSP